MNFLVTTMLENEKKRIIASCSNLEYLEQRGNEADIFTAC